MLTRPKVSDPFQVVRMAPRSIGDRPHSAPILAVPARGRVDCAPMEQPNRTIARLWRDAVARERDRARPTSSSTATTGTRSAGPRRPSASRTSRTASSRGASARATRSRRSRGRRSSGRCSTSRWRRSARSARAIYANSSPKDVAYILAHSEAVGVLCEDAGAGREGRGGARVAAAAPARAHLRRPRRRSRPRARAFKAEHPSALDDAVAAIDEDDLFTLHLHVGDDRPAEGLHDPPPQLLRDGRR